MYRAIVCTPLGELNCPNPVFRTREGCEEFWYIKMYEFGPAIESFVPVKINRRNDETRTDLAHVAMKMRLRVEPEMMSDLDKTAKTWNMYKELTPWDLDAAIGAMIDTLYKRKHKMVA